MGTGRNVFAVDLAFVLDCLCLYTRLVEILVAQ